MPERRGSVSHRAHVFSAIFNSTYQFIGLLSPEGVLLEANRSLLEFAGVGEQDVLGKALWETPWWAHSEEACQELRRAVAEAANGKFVRYEVEVHGSDGRRALLDFSLKPVHDESGRVTHIVPEGRDISARRVAERAREEHGRRLAVLSRRLVDVQEDERRRLAATLHDLVSPNLAAIKINLSILETSLPGELLAALAPRLADTLALLDDTNASIREISADYRPVLLDYAGLVSAVEGYAHRFSGRTGIRVNLDARDDGPRLQTDVEALLFRIIQEALTNCAKHAGAHSVAITLEHDAQHAKLTIVDDGRGFDPEALGKTGQTPGLGLLTMRERAEFAGGRFQISSRRGSGTRIEVTI